MGGSIPAWAGETCEHRTAAGLGRVYPRVGGGNITPAAPPRAVFGLSPRGRGKPLGVSVNKHNAGSIPAWAGETEFGYESWVNNRVYPRVGGGNDAQRQEQSQQVGLSPRGRGKPIGNQETRIERGSIPAWAGETTRRPTRMPPWSVYPRVGGGNAPGLAR